ncbi:hypothetical protein FA15DRAFT_667607 [Coprinopsis marcescibilis]|uniref:Uncharacterized protein n=1 Tax=Coprinopsis marcescibilis TaxID=230819 RepID=A0A5C3L072_COPMA|nr:hypothetical protein FA15DRAFT_667607 [Coprinopsis marcescibilis]
MPIYILSAAAVRVEGVDGVEANNLWRVQSAGQVKERVGLGGSYPWRTATLMWMERVYRSATMCQHSEQAMQHHE